jgi:hypothetical protein
MWRAEKSKLKTRSRSFWRLALALALVSSTAILLVIPETRYALPGLWRGERFYSGRPTSYWRWRILAYDHGYGQSTWADWYDWLEEHIPFLPHYDRIAGEPLAACDAGAAPMLGQLIGDSEPIVSARAAFHLIAHFGDWATAAWTLSRSLRSAPTEVRRNAVDRMAEMDVPIASLLVLKPMLSDNDLATRVQAAVSVLEIRPDDVGALSALVKALLRDGELNNDALFELEWPNIRITDLAARYGGCGYWHHGSIDPLADRCRLVLAASKGQDSTVCHEAARLLALLTQQCRWSC